MGHIHTRDNELVNTTICIIICVVTAIIEQIQTVYRYSLVRLAYLVMQQYLQKRNKVTDLPDIRKLKDLFDN